MKKKPRITGQYQPKRPVWPWLVALIAALLFMWLGYYSQTVEQPYSGAMTQHGRNQMNALLDSLNEQTAYRKVALIQELYHISDEEITQPVDLFHEGRKL